MPYIAIKAYPRDEGTKRRLVERINEVLLETWGCPQEAVTISLEEVEPADWNRNVREQEILPNDDKMVILDGQKRYEILDENIATEKRV